MGASDGAAVGASVLSQHGKYVSPSAAGQHRPVKPSASHRGQRPQSASDVGALDGAAVGAREGAGDGNDVGLVEGAGDGLGVSHVMSDPQTPLSQSLASLHFLPTPHGWHTGPPQSTSVSPPPPCMLSVHVADVGRVVGLVVGLIDGAPVVGAVVGCLLGANVGAFVGASVFWQHCRNSPLDILS